MVSDEIGGILGGLAGITAMTILLVVADELSGFQLQVFESLAALVGMPGNVLLGFFLFFAGGALLWPLVFVSFSQYLPGGRDPVRGMVFATVLWVSYVFAFSGDLGGAALALYAIFALFVHWVYGFLLGWVYGRLAEHRTQRV